MRKVAPSQIGRRAIWYAHMCKLSNESCSSILCSVAVLTYILLALEWWALQPGSSFA